MDSQSLLVFIAGAMLPSFVIALVTTYFGRANAARFGLIDLPGERKVHATPTPRGGGLAVWFGVIGTFALAQLALWYVTRSSSAESLVPAFARSPLAGIWAQSGKLWILLAAGTLLMLLGLAD